MRKIYLVILFFWMNLFICYSSVSTIGGQVLNYNSNSSDTIISICNTIYGLNGQICKDVPLKSTGEFKTEIELYRNTEVVVAYHENYIRLPLKPNQKININIDAKEFRKDKRIPKTIEIEGDNKATYEIILDYSPKYLERFYYHKRVENDMVFDEMDYKAYYDYRTNYLREEFKFLEAYIELHDIEDKLFIDWAKSSIKYDYGYFMHHFHISRPNSLIDPIPEWYLDSIEQFTPLNNMDALSSESYESYLHYKKMNLSEKFKHSEESRRLIDNNKTVWEGRMRYLINHSEGLAKDIMLGKLMDEYLGYGQIMVVEKYLHEIADESIKNLIESKVKTLKIVN